MEVVRTEVIRGACADRGDMRGRDGADGGVLELGLCVNVYRFLKISKLVMTLEHTHSALWACGEPPSPNL